MFPIYWTGYELRLMELHMVMEREIEVLRRAPFPYL